MAGFRYISTSLSILFQPFLRFWLTDKVAVTYTRFFKDVSTLLEILEVCKRDVHNGSGGQYVSTLLEILDHAQRQPYEPQHDHGLVSTLLEILGGQEVHRDG